jgi:hypothetical protein
VSRNAGRTASARRRTMERELKTQGVLSEAEFEDQERRILGT